MTYADYEWFLGQDLDKYKGQWIAIVNKKIVAVGSEADKVINKAKTIFPNKMPFITKIRKELSVL